MPVSKSRRTKKSGQLPPAGRITFSPVKGMAGGQAIAMRFAGRIVLLVSILILGASTLSDPVAAVVRQGLSETMQRQNMSAPDGTLAMRAALLRHMAASPDDVRDMSQDDLIIVFGTPSLVRREGEVTAWQFASGECALDLYFRGKQRPVYAEYRVRGSAEGKVSKTPLDHKACLKSLFVKAAPISN